MTTHSTFKFPKLILAALVLWIAASVPASAQWPAIPNSGFENWHVPDTSSIEVPDGWVTTGSGVTKDEDSYEGVYSMKIETVMYEEFARTAIDLDAVPPALGFYIKSYTEMGVVGVQIVFYNGEEQVHVQDWNTSGAHIEWTPVTIELEQIEPVITHAVIRVWAEVGDFAPGMAEIQIDEMGFTEATSVADAHLEEVRVYPNPCKDVLYLEGTSPGTEYSMRDITGREVAAGITSSAQTSMDVTGLNAGVYLLRLHHQGEESVRKVFVR